MGYLVDADVLSEPTRSRPDPRVVDWLSRNERDLFVDAIVMGEIQLGIALLPGGRKRKRLEDWFESLAARMDCLPWDAAASRRWAALVAGLRRRGRNMPLFDSMIAATALTRGFTVATRNVADFQAAGVAVVNPFLG